MIMYYAFIAAVAAPPTLLFGVFLSYKLHMWAMSTQLK